LITRKVYRRYHYPISNSNGNMSYDFNFKSFRSNYHNNFITLHFVCVLHSYATAVFIPLGYLPRHWRFVSPRFNTTTRCRNSGNEHWVMSAISLENEDLKRTRADKRWDGKSVQITGAPLFWVVFVFLGTNMPV
jgi:hypothetical protein